MNQSIKVAITGAAGRISSFLLPRIASGQLFGPEVAVELQLLELEPALPTLQGVAMELEDCAFPLLKKIVCTSDLNTAMRDANWAILVGAVPRKAGMERGDLLNVNGAIFTAQGKAINDAAADDVRVLVVGNPCNTNCLIAMNHAPDVPNDRFYAMTALDEKRAQAQLAIKAGVHTRDVNNVTIWGNHSATQYPDFYNATIQEKPVTSVITDENWLQTTFIETVQQRGAAIIKALGASSAASAANAALSTIYDLTHETPEGTSYSVALASQGQYGVDNDLIYSFRCRTENGKCQVVDGITHNAFGEEKCQITLDELRAEQTTVKALGLV